MCLQCVIYPCCRQIRSRIDGDVRNTICRICIRSAADSWHSHRFSAHCAVCASLLHQQKKLHRIQPGNRQKNLIFSVLHMHPILLAWLVALILHAAVGSATVAMMGATAIVAPMLPLYPDISPEIIAIAIGSGAIGCTIVTDSLFWLVKQYCGATLNETFKYYTTATFIASVVALAGTFLLSFII